ncbi:MAG TPA: hypothetical protein VK932_21205 [Kofleriaceae bacterium]|nr:hypothetical protein [Kofleriaceae bacterium]
MTHGAARASIAAVAIAALGGPAARADTPRQTPSAIEVDRDAAPPGRTEFGFDGGAPLDGWGVTLGAGWLERPLTFTAADGAETLPVRRRQTLSIGGAIALGERAALDARFGAAHQVGDRLRPADPRALDRYVPGDLRLGARVRVAGDPRRAMFVRGELTLPTGDDGDFAGEASWTLAWQLAGRLVLPRGITAAAAAGIRLRGAEVVIGDRLAGDELTGALGVAVPVPALRPLWCDPEQVKLTAELSGALGDDVGAGRGPSPAEARLGLVTRPRPAITLGVRIARGLTDEIGAPRARLSLELTYAGAAPRPPRAE